MTGVIGPGVGGRVLSTCGGDVSRALTGCLFCASSPFSRSLLAPRSLSAIGVPMVAAPSVAAGGETRSGGASRAEACCRAPSTGIFLWRPRRIRLEPTGVMGMPPQSRRALLQLAIAVSASQTGGVPDRWAHVLTGNVQSHKSHELQRVRDHWSSKLHNSDSS